jgi:hypothetical protein
MDQARSYLGVVFDDCVELFGSFIESCREAAVSYLLAISRVGVREEVFELSEFVEFGVGECECVINGWIFSSFTYH